MKTYDDLGDGRYDYLGVDKRIPLHAKKAREFLEVGDLFNANQHAGKCVSLCARGWLGTPSYLESTEVLKKIEKISEVVGEVK